MAEQDLLSTGIYTVSEAAYLVRASRQQVRGWVEGYPGRKIEPLIENEIGWLENRLALSFTNLIELRFVAFFVNAGVSIQHIRSILGEVRVALSHPHPFATKLIFRTDRKKIVSEIALRNGGILIYDLRSRNYEMRQIVLESLADDVLYDADGIARAWYPRRTLAPNVIIHPKFSFGMPILRDSLVPTRTIASSVAAEGGVRSVASWYDIPEKQVREAVKFETALRKAA